MSKWKKDIANRLRLVENDVGGPSKGSVFNFGGIGLNRRVKELEEKGQAQNDVLHGKALSHHSLFGFDSVGLVNEVAALRVQTKEQGELIEQLSALLGKVAETPTPHPYSVVLVDKPEEDESNE